MQTELERPSPFRVLMRMPNLGAATAPARPARPAGGAAPWPDLPLSPEAPVQQPGDGARPQAVASYLPEAENRLRSPLAILACLAVITAALVAWGNRHRQTAPLPAAPSVEPSQQRTAVVPGGSPSELNSIPELSLTGAAPSATSTPAREAPPVERLPQVSPESRSPVGFDLSLPGAVPSGSEPALPGMARLDRRIETPTPEVSHDATRQSLY